MEAAPRFELGDHGFANQCLTAWLCRLIAGYLIDAPPKRRIIGAGDEARTRYLHLGKVALYQMSYARTVM